MHVVHVGKFYPPEYQGGLERVVSDLNAELRRGGADATAVVAAVRGGPRAEQVDGVRVVRARSLATVLSQPLAPGFPRAVRAEAGDLLHLHHPNLLGDWAVLDDPRPLVITHHSEIVRQAALYPLYAPLVRAALRRAARVAVGSRQLLEASRELRGFEHKTVVIPFGIDPARFAADDAVRLRAAALRAAWGPRPVVLAVGRLVAYKGFDVLCQAARGLDAEVVIVGSGPERQRLAALAPPNVRLAGHVDEAGLVAHYHACDVFCLPSVSIAEAFGMVLLEAMACGRPLVTTALPTGVSAINRDGETGLRVPVGDVGALRESLRALCGDAARREAMGRAAREVQAREYTARLMGDRYLSLYGEVLAAAPASGRRVPPP